jgi:hypothetical protein
MSDQNLKAQAALERLFGNSDDVTVEYEGSALGDYALKFEDTCFNGRKKQALKQLGFKPDSTHPHVDSDGNPTMTVYVNDSR